MSEQEVEIGREYTVRCRRKGTFRGIAREVNGDFVLFEITEGEAHYLSGGGYTAGPGELVSCRRGIAQWESEGE